MTKFTETEVQDRERLKASEGGGVLWRNNVGACYTDRGFIRYGLCNDSKKVNEKTKSSDLIGIKPLMITQEHVGKTIGQFYAREVKRPGWKYSSTKVERAQKNFIDIVNKLGGDARFTTGSGDT